MAATAILTNATAHGRRQHAATNATRQRGMNGISPGCGSDIGLFASVRKAGTLARWHRWDKRNREGDKVRNLPHLVTLSVRHFPLPGPTGVFVVGITGAGGTNGCVRGWPSSSGGELTIW